MKDGTIKKEWHYGYRAHIINPVIDLKHIWDKEEKYKEIENQMIVYNEEGEVFYIVDLNNYEKMKYLGYDKENNALRYTRYSTGKKIEFT